MFPNSLSVSHFDTWKLYRIFIFGKCRDWCYFKQTKTNPKKKLRKQLTNKKTTKKALKTFTLDLVTPFFTVVKSVCK